jgi:ADP-ribosylglycohydrolase
MTKQSQIFGSMIGGAVGDALGAAVEFMSLAGIRRSLGLVASATMPLPMAGSAPSPMTPR